MNTDNEAITSTDAPSNTENSPVLSVAEIAQEAIENPQLALPLAMVEGEAVTELPSDLYIPPQAMQVLLETFEGPLDLLLYLIRKQNLDILNIPIAQVTAQYLQYIEVMQTLELDLAAEYLVMAALLLEIKSRMLLPQIETEDEEDENPRERLLQQLQEYARFKQAAEDINDLPALGRDTFLLDVAMPDIPQTKAPPDIPLSELINAMRDVLLRMEMSAAHQILREPLSVRERMTMILELLNQEHQSVYERLFSRKEGKAGAVVAFLAILELAKEQLLQFTQDQAYGRLEVQSKVQDVTSEVNYSE
jgi:segregation and condensation protein A